MNIQNKAEITEPLNNQNVKIKHPLFKVELKQGISYLTFMAVPLLQVYALILGGFYNFEIIFLLRDEKFFNISSDQIGKVSSNLIFYSQPFQMAGTLIIGYVYDLCGRRPTIIITCLIAALATFLTPFTAPSVFPWLILLRIIISLCFVPANCQPLVNDYVIKESRGKASAIEQFGFIIGSLFTFSVIVTITKDMNYYYAFSTNAVFILIMAVIFYFIVKEPHRHQKEEEEHKNETLLTKIKRLSTRSFQVAKSDIMYLICFVGVTIARLTLILFTSQQNLWVTSFIDKGIISSDDEAKNIIQVMSIYGTSVSIVFFIFMGTLSDRFSPYYIIPAAFCIRFFGALILQYLDAPNTALTYLTFAIIKLGSVFSAVAVDSTFYKCVPKDIRGTMNGIYAFISGFGIIIFAKISGVISDEYGPQIPYLVVGIIDLLFALFVIIIGFCKQFKH